MTLVRFLVILLPFAYVLWHVWLLPPAAAWVKWALVGAGVACVGLFVLAMAPALDRLPLGLASAVYRTGSLAMVAFLYLFLFFAVADFLRLVRLLPGGFLSGNLWCTAGVALGVGLVLLLGSVHYRHKQRVEISIDTEGRLPQPLKAVAVSDLHIGYHNRRAELARWVDLLNAEHPDVVLVAGDIIDRSLRPLEEERMWEELRRLEAPVYACLGNHEYYASEARAVDFYRQAGVTLLRDSVADFRGLALVGRDDRTNPRRKPLAALAAQAGGRFTLVLDHQPSHLEEAEEAGVGFQFSGHTHYGQVWPVSWVERWLYECAWGEYKKGRTRYYVSSGLGIWGPTCRVGTQSEYVVLNLR